MSARAARPVAHLATRPGSCRRLGGIVPVCRARSATRAPEAGPVSRGIMESVGEEVRFASWHRIASGRCQLQGLRGAA